jgi:hypothetical protein
VCGVVEDEIGDIADFYVDIIVEICYVYTDASVFCKSILVEDLQIVVVVVDAVGVSTCHYSHETKHFVGNTKKPQLLFEVM